MHKVVGGVFKVLAVSVILMIVLDTSLMLVDIFSTSSKVMGVLDLVGRSVAQDNYLSDGAKSVYTEQLNDILKQSNTFKSLTLDPNNDLSVKNIGDYGEFKTVKISGEITTHVFGTQGNMKTWRNYYKSSTVDYTETLPCFRYLKGDLKDN